MFKCPFSRVASHFRNYTDQLKCFQMVIFVIEKVENIFEIGEMLVTSIFFFSHNVFNSFLFQNGYILAKSQKTYCLLGNRHFVLALNAWYFFQNKPWFSRVCSAGRLKTVWEKEILFVTSIFSFSQSVFYPS